MDEAKQILLHLSLINGVGSAAVVALLKALVSQVLPNRRYVDMHDILAHKRELSLDGLYQFSIADFLAMGLSQKISHAIVEGLSQEKMRDEESVRARKHGIKIISLCDDEYPDQLRHIAQPPIILYVQGEHIHNRRMFGIVGSRKATNYSKQFIDSTVPLLINNGWTIVSGGALGADTMAHQASLSGGNTVAVLGSGLLCPYPKENSILFEDIVARGGAIISPFALKTSPERWNFPARNRIIAGLSEGCLVVQAAEKSGALITAHHALENGRTVFAVPGPVGDPLSRGCHLLIKQGAVLVQSVQDICDSFGQSSDKGVQEEYAQQQCIDVIPQDSDDPLLIHINASVSIDELCDKTGFDVSYLQNRLFELQLEGKVEQDFTGMWQRT